MRNCFYWVLFTELFVVNYRKTIEYKVKLRKKEGIMYGKYNKEDIDLL